MSGSGRRSFKLAAAPLRLLAQSKEARLLQLTPIGVNGGYRA